MGTTTESNDEESPRERLGWKSFLAILALHTAALACATYPMVLNLGTKLPEAFDSLQHLWLMRWYRSCLWEGKSIFLCPQIQYPVGASLGSFSPLHLQSLLFLPLSIVLGNDILSYNLVWTFGLLMMGMGTSLLIWETVRSRRAAAFGGLLAMLSGPMTAHAHGHLELIYAGLFPLFLAAWMRFVDRPSRKGLILASAGYVLVAMSAAYFMVFAIFPAALYVVWRAAREGRAGAALWVRERSPWFLGFAGVSLPFLLFLFSGHLLAVGQGHSLTRSREEFSHFGAPLWNYLSPTPEHRLSAWLPASLCSTMDEHAVENISYLGWVTIGLLVYTAVHRVKARRGAFLWLALGLTVILSLGSSWKLGSHAISLPSAWLWNIFPPYRLTRVPARFNLFASVLAATLAAAGLRHLLSRLPRRGPQALVFATLTVLAVADLAVVPFWNQPVPRMPACYTFLKQRDPQGTVLEIPYLGTGGGLGNVARTYWQSLHGLTTSAGYSGHPNVEQETMLGLNSPFALRTLELPADTDDPTRAVCSLTLEEYVWLSLTVYRFDYVVLHRAGVSKFSSPILLDRVKSLLNESKIYEDEASIVYERARLRPPQRPVVLIRDGWRPLRPWQGRWNGAMADHVQLALYNPDPSRDLTFELEASALREARSVQLRSGAQILAQSQVRPGPYQSSLTLPFRLAAGLHDLTIESVGQNPSTVMLRARKDPRSLSLRIARLSIAPADAPVSVVGKNRTGASTLKMR